MVSTVKPGTASLSRECEEKRRKKEAPGLRARGLSLCSALPSWGAYEGKSQGRSDTSKATARRTVGPCGFGVSDARRGARGMRRRRRRAVPAPSSLSYGSSPLLPGRLPFGCAGGAPPGAVSVGRGAVSRGCSVLVRGWLRFLGLGGVRRGPWASHGPVGSGGGAVVRVCGVSRWRLRQGPPFLLCLTFFTWRNHLCDSFSLKL